MLSADIDCLVGDGLILYTHKYAGRAKDRQTDVLTDAQCAHSVGHTLLCYSILLLGID